MKKLFLLLGIVTICFTGCTQDTLNIDGIVSGVESSVSDEMVVTAKCKTVETGSDICLKYSGVEISKCTVSIISEWNEATVLSNTNIIGSDIYECGIKNNLKPGKYFITLISASGKSNSIEVNIVTADRTPYITKSILKDGKIKIYGSGFINGYAPVVKIDGVKADVISYSEYSIEIKAPAISGQRKIEVNAGNTISNTGIITI